MNESYSKDEVIAEAIHSILTGDTSNTGKTVREIMYYISDAKQIRYSSEFNVEGTYPMITFKVEPTQTSEFLPTGEFLLTITTSIKASESIPQTTLKRITARIDALIDNKPNALNNAVSSSKYLRCRRIKRTNSQEVHDAIKEVYKKVHYYEIQCDDEILN